MSGAARAASCRSSVTAAMTATTCGWVSRTVGRRMSPRRMSKTRHMTGRCPDRVASVRMTSNSRVIHPLGERHRRVAHRRESIARSNGTWLGDFIFQTLCATQRDIASAALAREQDIDWRAPRTRSTRVTRKGFPPVVVGDRYLRVAHAPGETPTSSGRLRTGARLRPSYGSGRPDARQVRELFRSSAVRADVARGGASLRGRVCEDQGPDPG